MTVFWVAMGACGLALFVAGVVVGAFGEMYMEQQANKDREAMRAAAFAQRMERKGWGDAA